jgi:hypothetical protein
VIFRSKTYPKLHGAGCATPQDCAEAYVKSTRERWERDDLDAKIKADLERNSQAAMRIGGPVKAAGPAPAKAIAPDSWQTTTVAARPTKTTRSGAVSSN